MADSLRHMPELCFILRQIHPCDLARFVSNVENSGNRVWCCLKITGHLRSLFRTVGFDVDLPNHPIGLHPRVSLSMLARRIAVRKRALRASRSEWAQIRFAAEV